MVHNEDIAKNLWGEAANTACHIVNIVYFRPRTKKQKQNQKQKNKKNKDKNKKTKKQKTKKKKTKKKKPSLWVVEREKAKIQIFQNFW